MTLRFLLISLALLDLFILFSLGRLPQGLRVEVLDVGQGDAILLSTPEQNHILIDGGPDARVLTELGAVLPPFVRSLDLVVLTHPHADHLVGLIPVLERFEVGAVLLSAPAYETEEYAFFITLLTRLKVPTYFAEAEQDFRLGGLTLDVLYPLDPLIGTHMENVNNASVVLMAEWETERVLLMGDAEEEVEALLVEHYGEALTADVLKVGHHGSKTSSTALFLGTVNPQVMLISCGVGNSYGHPSSQTLATAKMLEVEVWRTDLDGRISLELDPAGTPARWHWFYSWMRSIFAPSVQSFSSNFSYPRSM